LRSVAPAAVNEPTVVVLTPGMFNSAYFEHAFLAQQMGIELVEGQDLYVKDNFVYMRTTQGPKRVDVIYRRVDDDFLDRRRSGPTRRSAAPAARRLPGRQHRAVERDRHRRRRRQVDLSVRAEDDRVLPRREADPEQRADPTSAGSPRIWPTCSTTSRSWSSRKSTAPAATACWSGRPRRARKIDDFRAAVIADPERYIAQPTLSLSTCPTFVESGIAPRHIDLRPFVLSGKTVQMVPGGLTRVALKEGSLVVNSSQGGGTKDTWVLEA
jgi:hypothetical protein